VATLLEEGDACGARSEAQRLQADTIAAVNAGRIPPGLQEQTLADVTELAESITCGDGDAPPPGDAERLAERLRSSAG